MGITGASHGGSDPGATANGLKEKDLNLKAAQYMYQRLKELGIPTTIVRDSDETVNRDERVRRILDAYGNDPNVIVISNHINAGGGEGAEVVYALRNSSTLARNVLEAIGSEGQIMRKYYQRRLPEDPMKDYYFIHRLTGNTQPLLVEYGFIDNANDSKKLQNDLLDYVEAVVRALANYGGYTYVPPEGSSEYYTVQKGDSLWSIASKLGVSVNELRTLNNLTSDTLQIGQQLKIPGTSETPPPPSSSTTYTVQSGDSLWEIANRFGTTVDELKRLNNLTSNTLQIGQVLRLPGTTTTPDENATYTVQKGDSLWVIADRFDTTVDELKRLNNLTSNNLQIGQVLKLPSTSVPTPPTPPTEEENTYTVQRGDSLWSVANKLNTSVDELKRLNNLTSNLLQIGQVLKVPGNTSNEEPPSQGTVYTVKSGDSLWLIANRFGVTVNDIITANNLTSNVLSIGQQLIIPTSTNQTTYTVQRGDSLWEIAIRFGTTVDAIKSANNLTSNLLSVGQQLIIPS